MQRLISKRVLIPFVAIAALAIAGIAYAYFTSSGTGSGTATVGSIGDVTIDDVVITGTLYPDGPAATVEFTVNNPTDAPVKVGAVVADGVTGLTGNCLADDFTFADVAVGAEIAAGGSYDGSGELSLANTSANQDDCQGASPVLHLKVDNSGL
jgi:hypothetical protein